MVNNVMFHDYLKLTVYTMIISLALSGWENIVSSPRLKPKSKECEGIRQTVHQRLFVLHLTAVSALYLVYGCRQPF